MSRSIQNFSCAPVSHTSETTSPMSDVITYPQAARLLGVPVGTLYCWVHERRIPHIRLGARLVRFSRTATLEWLKRHHVAAKA